MVVKNDTFRKYLATELETYSDHTIDLYYRAVVSARRARRNLIEERGKTMFNATEAA
jgi:hypothetical protein